MTEIDSSSPRRGKVARGILKIRYFFFASIALVCLLAGCHLQNILSQQETSIPSTAQTATAYDTQLATTPTVSSQTASVQLVLWLPPSLDPENGTPGGMLLKQRLMDFEDEHPGYIVEVRIKALEGRGGLLDSLSTASNAAPEALPSVIALPYKEMEAAVLKEMLLSLDYQHDFLNDPDWLPYASQMARIQDTLYGFPFAGDALVLAYNPLQSPFPPKTWNELTLQNQKVAFPAADPDATAVTFFYMQAGGNLLDENKSPVIQELPLQRTFVMLSDGTRKGVFPYWLTQFSTFDQSWNSFLNQQSDYALIWASEYFQSQPANALITKFPVSSENDIFLAQGWSWCIPKKSPVDQQNSLLLAQYLSDPLFVNELSKAEGYLPVRTSGLKQWEDTPDFQLVSEIASNAILVPASYITNVTSPSLEESSIQIIKGQIFYQQAIEQVLGHFTVQ